jgi:hypothetical protein
MIEDMVEEPCSKPGSYEVVMKDLHGCCTCRGTSYLGIAFCNCRPPWGGC